MRSEPEKVRILFNKLVRAPLSHFPLPRVNVAAANDQGVYLIYSPKGKILHVGRTYRGKNGLAQRLRDHMFTASSFTNQYLEGRGFELRNGYKFRYLVVKDARLRALIEAYAIGRLCPAHIGLSQSTSKNSN